MRETLTFFFWNLNRRSLGSELRQVTDEHEVDIVLLAENALTDAKLQAALPRFSEPETYAEKISIYTRGDPARIVPVFDDPARRLTIRRLTFRDRPDILLAAVHFYDKRNWSDAEQLTEATVLAGDICKAEDQVGHRRTILVGDLNMNPFDKAVVASSGIHGMMTRELARRGTRTVAAREYRFFYNPMWSLLGERAGGPPGTHFHSRSTPIAYFWHMLDQVLVRPDLMDNLKDVRILDSIAGKPIVSKDGRPRASDHLPILFRIELA